MTSTYSLRKCKQVFKEASLRHKKLAKRLSNELLGSFEQKLDSLGLAIQNKELDHASLYAYEVQDFLKEHGRKSLFEQIWEFTGAIIFALIIAALVRQMWFELYEIPTGSMRPTFRESDRVLVFKDAFCINKPFETAHFYFEPQYVERGSIVVVTGDGLDLPDVDTVYFGLFPGKRRYVKRSVAKDGDKIYFYGGKIYGIDKEGKPLESLISSPVFSNLEYVPFISFEGKVDSTGDSFIIRHMNIPVAKISVSSTGMLSGSTIGSEHSFGVDWGLNNFAISRLLEPQDLPNSANQLGYANDDALLYLELKHSPTLAQGHKSHLIDCEYSWIGLDHAHLEKIRNSLYTARFYIRKGIAYRYTPEGPDLRGRGIMLDTAIPDGCYEFIDGAAYEIGWGAVTHLLPPTHPIYPHTLKGLKALYNSGIDFSISTNNTKKHGQFPTRYTYFRDGSLYTLGKELFTRDDSLLTTFIAKEKAREKQQKSYIPFIDRGPPVKDGTIDADFIKSYGLTINEGYYLLLGDNHAMSNDSRFFGSVPQKNLQGSPALLFWPPGERWGRPPQPERPFFRTSNVIVVTSAIVITYLIVALYNRRTRYRKRP